MSARAPQAVLVAAVERAAVIRMRLAALAVLVAGPAWASDRAHGSVLIYSDTDHVQVISPTVAGSVDMGKATVSSVVSLDLISAASVDLVTAASPSGYTETRTQVDASGRYALGEGANLEARYHLSHEPDFLTHSVQIGGKRDIFARQISLGAGYGYSHSQIGRTQDTVFSRLRDSHDLEVSATRVISPVTAVDVAYGVSLIDGFQASPYRFVRLYSPGTTQHQTAVTEQTPNTRVRQSFNARVRTRPIPGLFLQADSRLYADSWGMWAQTLTLRAVWALGSDEWTLTVEARGHRQNAADFYQARYTTFPGVPAHRTADKELGPMWTGLTGSHVEWSPDVAGLSVMRLSTGFDILHMRYLDYAFLSSRTALLVSIGSTIEF